MSVTSKEIRLASRPVGMPKDSDFEVAEASIADPKDGEVLVQQTYQQGQPLESP